MSNEQTYEVRPCPECPPKVKVSFHLHELYDQYTREPLPQSWKELLARLK